MRGSRNTRRGRNAWISSRASGVTAKSFRLAVMLRRRSPGMSICAWQFFGCGSGTMYGDVIEAREGGRGFLTVGEVNVLVERPASMLPLLWPLVAVVAVVLSKADSVTLCLSDEGNGERDLRFGGETAPVTCALIGDRR